MSMIEKMSILGIRSFGVGDGDIQVIEFQHPLTMLVGLNGAGKTTVIECLKYITTGDAPSNCKGGGFVHDPKLADEVEVKAQVRLRYRNLQKEVCQITRCLKATQKAKSVSVTTLDGLISKKKNGEKVQITSKCANLNSEMESALGVSKAVLENVIFCHQEESNWPLADGGSVKKKFDEIFAATRYNKASDEIKKVKKDQDVKARDAETKETYCRKFRDEAHEKRSKLEDMEFKLSVETDNKMKLQKEIGPIEDKLHDLKKRQMKVCADDMKLKQAKNDKKLRTENRDRLKRGIKNLFHGTDEQLADMNKNHASTTNQKEVKKEEAEEEIITLENSLRQLSQNKSHYIQAQGKLQQEKETYERTKHQCQEEIEQYSSTFDLAIGATDDNAVEVIENHDSTISMEHDELKDSLDAEVSGIQSKIEEAWKSKTELEEGIKHKKESMNEKKMKYDNTKKEIERLKIVSDSNKMELLKKNLEKAETELADLENNSNVETFKSSLNQNNDDRKSLELEVKKLDGKIEKIQKFSQLRSRVDFLKKDLSSKEESVQKLKRKHSEALKKIGLLSSGSVKNQKFPSRANLQSWLSNQENEINQLEKKIKKKRDQFTKLTTQREILIKQTKEKEKQKDNIDDLTFELCGSQTFEDELEEVKVKCSKLQEGKGVTDGIQYMYKKYLEKLNPDEGSQEVSCPLCHRLFDKKRDVEELADELRENLEIVPKKLKTQEEELGKMQLKMNELLQHKPKKEEFDELNTTIIPKLKGDLTGMNEKISSVKSDLETDECQLQSLKDDEATGRPCLGDLSQIDSTMKEITVMSKDISSLEAQIPGSQEESFEEVNQLKKNKQEKLQKVNHEIERVRSEMERQTELLNNKRDVVNKLRDEKHELDSDLQKFEQLKETKVTLENECKRLKYDMQQSMKDKQPIESKLEELKQQKKNKEKSRDAQLKESFERLKISQRFVQTIKQLSSNIRSYERGGNAKKLNQTQQRLAKIETDIETKQSTLNDLNSKVKTLEKDIANCQDRKRNITDNIELRKQEKEIVRIETEIEEINEKLQGTDPVALERQMNELTSQINDKSRELERCKTRQEEGNKTIRDQKVELNKDDYKFADENHKNELIEAKLRRLAASDLAKYQVSLDHAIMRYHHIKMEEINRIIKEIWLDTYCGTDIDYIEISSDAEGGTATKRQHNYRVVKVFDGIKTDMRGRCSAGQKVLASLVIRLALAETFCINCGILALDEPTTNLDREHISKLAHALGKIIESRSRQHNFQLIVITHDEDFVELLSQVSSFASHYFNVKKDTDGKSRIFKHPISRLRD